LFQLKTPLTAFKIDLIQALLAAVCQAGTHQRFTGYLATSSCTFGDALKPSNSATCTSTAGLTSASAVGKHGQGLHANGHARADKEP
jgi:hypothetical protein